MAGKDTSNGPAEQADPLTPEFAKLQELMEQQVSSPADMLTLARAKRLLVASEPKMTPPFYRTGEFFKYLGATLGALVATIFLVSQGIIANTTAALDSRDTALKTASTTLETLENTLAQQQALAETTRLKLEEQNTALQQATTASAELQTKSEALQAKVTELDARVAEERVTGASLYLCEKKRVMPLFDRLTANYDLPRYNIPADWATMRLYLLRENQLAFTLFAKYPDRKYSIRRSETGTWETTQSSYELLLELGKGQDLNLTFDRSALQRLLLSKSLPYACANETWCFYRNRECDPDK